MVGFYDLQPGNAAVLYPQPWSLHTAHTSVSLALASNTQDKFILCRLRSETLLTYLLLPHNSSILPLLTFVPDIL